MRAPATGAPRPGGRCQHVHQRHAVDEAPLAALRVGRVAEALPQHTHVRVPEEVELQVQRRAHARVVRVRAQLRAVRHQPPRLVLALLLQRGGQHHVGRQPQRLVEQRHARQQHPQQRARPALARRRVIEGLHEREHLAVEVRPPPVQRHQHLQMFARPGLAGVHGQVANEGVAVRVLQGDGQPLEARLGGGRERHVGWQCHPGAPLPAAPQPLHVVQHQEGARARHLLVEVHPRQVVRLLGHQDSRDTRHPSMICAAPRHVATSPSTESPVYSSPAVPWGKPDLSEGAA